MVPLALALFFAAADPAPEKPATAKDGLKPFQGLVGTWKGTGYPDGTREERDKGHWTAVAFVGAVALGKQKEVILTLDRTDKAAKETQRLVVTLLHSNRYLYRFETKPEDGGSFTRKYLVGATKEGEPFATVAKGPECVVTGGTANGSVTYKGKAYPICCSGCRDAFLDDPEKYVKEFEKAKK